MDDLKLFIPITKMDEDKRLVYGRATEETPDSAGEVFDYASSKPYFEEWVGYFQKATDGKSCGNLRAMHDAKKAVGNLPEVILLDKEKAVEVVAKVVDDGEWAKCLEGVYTGFSQGGKYVRRWNDGKNTRYTAQPNEISLVDYPMLKTATFSLVKVDGKVEDVPFKNPPDPTLQDLLEKGDSMTDAQVTDLVFKHIPLNEIDARWSKEEAIEKLKNFADPKNMTQKGDAVAEKKELKPDGVALKKWAGEEISDVRVAIEALSWISDLYLKEVKEGKPEDVAQAALLKTCIESLKKFISSEIQEDHYADVAAFAEGIKGLIKADTKEEDLNILVKAFDGLGFDLQKRGAAISSKNLSKIQSMHDGAVELGAKCNTGKAEPSGDLEKAVIEKDEALKKVSELTGKIEQMTKAETERNAADQAAAQKRAKDLETEIERLKKSAEEKDQQITKITALAAENEVLKGKEKERDEALQKVETLTKEKDALSKELTEKITKVAELESKPAPAKGAISSVAITKADDTNPDVTQKDNPPTDPLEAMKKIHAEPKMWVARKIEAKVSE